MYPLNQFIQKFSVRPGASLSTAPVLNSNSIVLPKLALVHYVTDTAADMAIRGSNMLLAQHEGDIRISFITDGYGDLPGSRKVPLNTNTAIKNFRNTQRRFRVVPDPGRVVRVANAIGVFDYSLMVRMYTYQDNINKFYHSWHNMTKAIAEKVEMVGVDREQFITIRMPRHLPSFEQVKKVEDGLNTSELGRWTEEGHFWLRELHRLIMGKSDLFNVKGINNTWFVFQDGAKSVILNAGDLLVRAEKQSLETSKKVFRLLERLIENRTVADTSALEKEVSDAEIESVDETKEVIPGLPNTAAEKIAALGQAGKLTAAEQRRFITIAQRQGQIQNPFAKKGTISEMMEITAEDIAIKPELDTQVNDKVVPAHAKLSATTSFTRDYVKNGLVERNTMRMLDSFKRAGVFITEAEVIPEIDAVNNANILKVKLLPLQGKQSTLPIVLHKFDEQGHFLADGVKYAMDAQWNDRKCP